MLFRLCSRIPHLVWLVLYGVAAFVARVRRLAVVRSCSGGCRARCTASSRPTRATPSHLSAYLCLAADPYPGFTRGTAVSGRPRDRPTGKAAAARCCVPARARDPRLRARRRRSAGAIALGALARAGLAASWSRRGARLVRLPRARRACRAACATPPHMRSATGARRSRTCSSSPSRYPDATPGRRSRSPSFRAPCRGPGRRRRSGVPRLLVAFRAPLCMPTPLADRLVAFAARRARPRVGRGTRHRPRPRLLHRFLAAYVRATDAPAGLPLRSSGGRSPASSAARGLPDRPADRGARAPAPARRPAPPRLRVPALLHRTRTPASPSSPPCSAGSRRWSSGGCREVSETSAPPRCAIRRSWPRMSSC